MKSGTISNEGAYDGSKALNQPFSNATSQSAYSQKISVKRGMLDNEAIMPKTRTEYVADFQRCLENCVAPENYLDESVTDLQRYLDKCVEELWCVLSQVVQSLEAREGRDFYKEICLTPPSVIRTFLEIGRAYPDTIERFTLTRKVIDSFSRFPMKASKSIVGGVLPEDIRKEIWKK